MRCIVKLNSPITPETVYLKSLYPCAWTNFISEAMGFSSIEEAKMQINHRHYQITDTLTDPKDIGYISIDCYENGILIGNDYYLRRD